MTDAQNSQDEIKKPYRLVIEVLCPNCSINNCSDHLPKKEVIDRQTGLVFDAVCTCTSH